jgi:hypothetical protein
VVGSATALHACRRTPRGRPAARAAPLRRLAGASECHRSPAP